MSVNRRTKGMTGLLVALGALVTLPGLTEAQTGGEGFLFRRPVVSFGIRTGYSVANAGSEIFDFTREQLTVDKNDFSSGYFGGELAARVSPRLDIVLSVGHSRSEIPSEFRDWVDADDLPIQQRTEFSTTPVTVGARYYVTGKGRSIGRFAWVPTKVAPYVGGGAGWVWYSFEQSGDFVDFASLDVFPDVFFSDGRSGAVHGLAGVDLSLNNHLVLSAEGRYQWAKGTLDQDFIDFDRMDLSGFQLTLGLSARF